MSIITDIWEGVRTTLVGLKITIPYIWRKPVTQMYPHQQPVLPERVRNRLYVNMDDCIGCDQCSRACPVNCISIETVKAVDGDSPGLTSNGKKKALWVTRFDIDIAKCCYCALCVYPCPTECINMSDIFEFSEQERNNLVYSYITLTPAEIVEKIEMQERSEKELAERKAAAKDAPPAAAAAPAKTAAPAAAVAPASVGNDPEKAAKLAELQAKMAAAKAKTQGDAPSAPAPTASAPSASDDDEKAARVAAMKAKLEAAKASAAGAAPAQPAPPQAAAAPAPPQPPAAPSGDDPEKAARIAAMQAKIAEAKAKKGL